MQHFFGGSFKQTEKPQSVHPRQFRWTCLSTMRSILHTASSRSKASANWSRDYTPTTTLRKSQSKALVTACAFYDADWAGVIELDLELNIWGSGWWYNTDPSVKKLEKLQEFENLMVMPSVIEAIKKQKPILFSDVEDIAKTSPKKNIKSIRGLMHIL